MNIIVCDNDSFVQDEIRQVFKIVMPDSSVIALQGSVNAEKLMQLDPGLIVLGLEKRDDTGLELLKKIRAGSSVPVITMASNTDMDIMVKALDSGANGHAGKPLRLMEFAARVRAVLRRWGYQF